VLGAQVEQLTSEAAPFWLSVHRGSSNAARELLLPAISLMHFVVLQKALNAAVSFAKRKCPGLISAASVLKESDGR